MEHGHCIDYAVLYCMDYIYQTRLPGAMPQPLFFICFSLYIFSLNLNLVVDSWFGGSGVVVVMVMVVWC